MFGIPVVIPSWATASLSLPEAKYPPASERFSHAGGNGSTRFHPSDDPVLNELGAEAVKKGLEKLLKIPYEYAAELVIPAVTISQSAAWMGAILGGVASPWKEFVDVKAVLDVFKDEAQEKIKRGVPAYRRFLQTHRPILTRELFETSLPSAPSNEETFQTQKVVDAVVLLQNRVQIGRSFQPFLESTNGVIALVSSLDQPQAQKAFLILARKWSEAMFLTPDERGDGSKVSPFTLATRYFEDFYGAGAANPGLRKTVARWAEVHGVGALPLVAFRAINDTSVSAETHAENVAKLIHEPRHFGISRIELGWLTGMVPLQLQDRFIDRLILNRDTAHAVRAGHASKDLRGKFVEPLVRWALLPSRNERVVAFDALAKATAAHKNGQPLLATLVSQFDPIVWYGLSGPLHGLLELKKPPSSAVAVVVDAARRWGGNAGREAGAAIVASLKTKSLDPLQPLRESVREGAKRVFNEMFPPSADGKGNKPGPSHLEAKSDAKPVATSLVRVRDTHVANPLLRKRIGFLKVEAPEVLPAFSDLHGKYEGTESFKYAIEDDTAFAVVVQVLKRGKKDEVGKLAAALEAAPETARAYFMAHSEKVVTAPAGTPNAVTTANARVTGAEIRIPDGKFNSVFVITQPPKVVDRAARDALEKDFPELKIEYPDWKLGAVTGGGIKADSLVVVISSRVSHAYELAVMEEVTGRKATPDRFEGASYSRLSEYLTKVREQNNRS